MVIINGILTFIIWMYVLVLIEKKFGKLAAMIWFFLGLPISMLIIGSFFNILGWTGGNGGGELSCYQNQYGTFCD